MTLAFKKKVIVFAVIIFSLLVGGAGFCGDVRKPLLQDKRVLLLFSYHPTFITSDNLLSGVRSVLEPYGLTLDIEYMDSKRRSDDVYMDKLSAFLKEKISRRDPYDAIIVSDDNALDLSLKFQEDVFKNIPIVFMAVNNVDKAMGMDANPFVTGVIESITPEKTIQLAQKIHPDLNSITLIADGTRSGRADIATIEKLYSRFPNLLFNLLRLDDYSWSETKELLKKQIKNSVLLQLAAYRDKNGLVLSYEDSTDLIVGSSPVPVYVLREHGVQNGAFGGNVISFYEQGRRAALIAETILKGTPIDNMKVIRQSPNQNMFDYYSLKRFGLGESVLPDDSVILNQPVTIFEEYGQYVWTAIVAITLLVVFVFFLLYEARERRKVEAALKLHQDHLEDMVKERTSELEAANKDLESFSYSVSHDLRSPLRGIDGYSHILLSDYRDSIDTEGQGYLDKIRQGAQRMAKLIDDILELSRVTRYKLKIEQLNLSEITADIVDRLNKIYENRDIEIDIQTNLKASGDKHLIEVVLQNLLDNAFKYTSKTEQARIEVGCRSIDKEPVYYVSDNGIGFDMEYSDKLFKAFQRLHDVEEFPGTGIGLASVFRVISRHGGRVWAESELGKGATFYFTLPQ